ncbi:hypothetical protein SJ_190 [Proteus phage SJ_PmiM]|nr:hypothetical protein SJ_190 [Proteus phage SJ_PmiM]
MDKNVFYLYRCSGSTSNTLWSDIRDSGVLTYNKTKFSIDEIKKFLYEVADSIKFYNCEFDAAIELNIPFQSKDSIKDVYEIKTKTNAVVFRSGNSGYALFLTRAQTSQLMLEIPIDDFTKAKSDFINSKITNDRNKYIETCRKKIEACHG